VDPLSASALLQLSQHLEALPSALLLIHLCVECQMPPFLHRILFHHLPLLVYCTLIYLTTPTDIETTTTNTTTMGGLCDVGLYGLAVMGQNFALNMAEHGFTVCVGNRSPSKVASTVERARIEGNLPLLGSTSPADFCQQLSKPRKIILLVQAGSAVDDTLAQLVPHLEADDIVIDGGNEWYPNQIRRAQELAQKGIRFMAMGISGGEAGARSGPSLMPGGPREAYELIAPILNKCAAQVGKEPCTGYCGPIGAGNYVKMVHNGIEYGDMQLIGEVYDILKVQLYYRIVLTLCRSAVVVSNIVSLLYIERCRLDE
jgi:6-phosphogluconate dehydrogenase (decarboxylating)